MSLSKIAVETINLIRETKIPDIPSTQGLDPAVKKVVDPLVEAMRVRLGRAGDALDQGLTWRDLYNSGFMKVVQNQQTLFNAPDGPFQPAMPIEVTDNPTAPTGLTATGAMTSIFVSFDMPLYRSHAYTEIWRSTDDNLSHAIMVGTTRTQFYTDSVGTQADYFYWARHVSRTSLKGPFNAVEGTEGRTQADPAYLISQLSGQINNSSLATDLASRIDLVDGPANLENSVAYQVQQESITRANGDNALNARIDQLTAGGGTTLGNNIYSQASAPTAQKAGDVWFDTGHFNQVNYWDGGQWVLVRDSGITSNAAAISNEATTRANADSNLTSQVNALTSTVNTNNSNQTAAINSEASTRASADSALGGRIDSLTTTVNNNYNTLSSNITTEQNARTSGDQTNANAITSLKSSISDANGNQLVTASSWNSLNTTVSTQGNTLNSQATSISQLQSSVNGNTSSIQTLQSVQNGLTAQYMVKLDTNGYVSGFGLYNNGATSKFIVRTDTFAIVPVGAAAGQAGINPFMVDSGNVYINSAIIKNASITSAMIGSIAAEKIMAGTISAALSLNAATINGGSLNINNKFLVDGNGNATLTDGAITLSSAGYLRGGQTDFNSGNGFFLGKSNNAFVFSIGDGVSNSITWDGTKLKVRGDLQLKNYTTGNILVHNNGSAVWTQDSNWHRVKATQVPRAGIVSVKYDLGLWVHAGSSITAEIRVNGVSIAGTQSRFSDPSPSFMSTPYQQFQTYGPFSVTVNPQDIIEVWATCSWTAGNNASYTPTAVQNLAMYCGPDGVTFESDIS